jgi:hypothetical protein
MSRLRSPAHLAWIRTQPCCVAGCRNTRIHAHHVRTGQTGGLGLKPSDLTAVPLCAIHHDEVHRGARTFERVHGLDLRELARSYADASPAFSGAFPA